MLARATRSTLALLLLATAGSGAARAQESDGEARAKLKEELRKEIRKELEKEIKDQLKQEIKTELKEEMMTAAPPPGSLPPGASPTTAAPAPAQPWWTLPFLERLPPSAFPEDKVRGIHGGSLWMTMHGAQWPYYPKSGIGVSGYVWLDPGYEQIKRGNPTEQNIKYWLLQGRLVLRITPTYTHGRFFVQGQAELVANKDQSLHQPDIADTDDLWIKVGMWNIFDVQVGRYEGWEVYHFGMGLDLYTLERQGALDEAFSVPGIYGLTYAFYRPAGVGNVAIHVYPTKYLRFEVGAQFGNEFGQNTLATRPVGILDFGWIKFKAGLEYKKLTDQKDGSKGETTQRGVGGAIQLVLNPWIEGGFSGAYGLVDRVAQDGTVDEKGSNSTWSVGGFANGRIIPGLVVGGGINYTYLEDIHFDAKLNRVEKFAHWQGFGAIQYFLLKQMFVKLVVAYAKADFAPNFGEPVFKNEMYSARIRLLYTF
jgi:hypothetical protein